MEQKGARLGRGTYICFMTLFHLTWSLLSLVPSQVLLGGGCAQEADRVKLLLQQQPRNRVPTWGSQRPLHGYENFLPYPFPQNAVVKTDLKHS